MPKLEFGQLYKFVVSLGFVLMAAAFVGPWAILRDQGALMVSESSLAELTPSAQRVLGVKQAHAERIIEWYPWIALALFVLGAAISIWGLRQWWKRQKVADKRENVDLELAERGLAPQTSAEEQIMFDLKAVESAISEPEAETDDGPANVDPSGADGAPTDAEAPLGLRPRGQEWLRYRIRDLEHLAGRRIAEALEGSHNVEGGVKALSADRGGSRYADLVALSAGDGSETDYVFDIKWAERGIDRRRVADSIVAASLFAASLRSPRAAAVSLVLIEDAAAVPNVRRRARDAVEQVRPRIAVPSGAVVLGTAELASIPAAQLRALIVRAPRLPVDPTEQP